jgi:hypothetical protein
MLIRFVIFFWALPLGLFWGWYFLSLNDINFGFLFLSRVLHDAVFRIYGDLLGIDPAIIPGMLVKACILDSALIGAILAWRRRRSIRAWIDSRGPSAGGDRETVRLSPEEGEGGREHPAG